MRPAPVTRIAAIAAAVVVAGCVATPPTPSVTQSPPPSATARPTAAATPSPTTTASPSPTLSANLGRRWGELTRRGDFAKSALFALSSTTRGLFASGFEAVASERRVYGVIWLSEDGRAWRRVTGKAGFADGSVGEIVQAADGTFLAQGTNCAYQSECSGLRFWSSTDGARWSASRSNLPPFAEVQLIAGRSGWVAAGTTDNSRGELRAWTSLDGRTWASAAGLTGTGHVFGVVDSGLRLVAYGNDATGARVESAIWTSTNGLRWSRLPRAATPRGTSIMAMVRKDDLLVALAEAGESIEIWTSVDGASWKKRDGAAQPFVIQDVRDVRNWDVASGPGGIAAFGTADVGGGNVRIGGWWSSDGLIWKAIEDHKVFDARNTAIYDVAHHGTEVLAVGSRSCSGACAGACEAAGAESVLWVSPPR